MSHTDSKYSISNRHIFCWKSFKIDIRNIDSICWKKKEIRIPCVFHSDISQIHWRQDLPTVCKLVGRWSERDKTQIYSGENWERNDSILVKMTLVIDRLWTLRIVGPLELTNKPEVGEATLFRVAPCFSNMFWMTPFRIIRDVCLFWVSE